MLAQLILLLLLRVGFCFAIHALLYLCIICYTLDVLFILSYVLPILSMCVLNTYIFFAAHVKGLEPCACLF